MVSHPTHTQGDEKKQSVAERSVLSQNFVIGEEKSERSLIGASTDEDVSKAYDEYKEAVNKLSRYSTASTHHQFMDEISDRK